MRAAVLRAARAGHGAGDENFLVHGQRHGILPGFGGHHSPACQRALQFTKSHDGKCHLPAFATQPLTIALLVLPQASILEVASALDPLRNANRQLGHEAYRWRVVSPDGRRSP
jgi:hypothetical protein